MPLDAAREFVRFWASLHTQIPTQIPYMTLAQGYSARHRKFHTWQHVLDCLDDFEVIRGRCNSGLCVEAAIWFHDCAYHPSLKDNVEASVEKARDTFRGAGLELSTYENIVQLIKCTKHDSPPVNWDAQLLCDIDLGILGKHETTYDFYSAAIREEYGFCNDSDYAKGRCMALRRLAQRTHIYSTEHFRKKYEDQARKNITRELIRIGGCVEEEKKLNERVKVFNGFQEPPAQTLHEALSEGGYAHGDWD